MKARASFGLKAAAFLNDCTGYVLTDTVFLNGCADYVLTDTVFTIDCAVHGLQNKQFLIDFTTLRSGGLHVGGQSRRKDGGSHA